MTDWEELSDREMRQILAFRVKKLREDLSKAELAYAAYSDGNTEEELNGTDMNQWLSSGNFIQQQFAYLSTRGEPLSAKELFVAHDKRNEDYTSTNGTFSGQLSTHCKNGALVRQYTIDDVSNRHKYWYAPKEWFVGHKLQEKYLKKIYDKVPSLA